jgi:hypothetical protein
LKHRYLVGIAVDPADPDTVIVSATGGPSSAYSPQGAEAYVYRKSGEQRWEQSMSGLPVAKGTTVSRFATDADEPGVIYAATTTASSDQEMQDGDGRLWTSLGHSPGLQMAWRRLPVFRSDRERRSAVVSPCNSKSITIEMGVVQVLATRNLQ